MTQKPKILLIEDDEAIRNMYLLKFEASSIDVHVATDGTEGLSMAHSLRPDLLLLDIKIPTIGGEDVLHILQTTTDWAQHMKVIVMSNISREVAPKKLELLNIDHYLIKAHATPSQVIDMVKRVLNIKTV
jgi:DNA-binding response OmpR family regulator